MSPTVVEPPQGKNVERWIASVQIISQPWADNKSTADIEKVLGEGHMLPPAYMMRNSMACD